MFFLEHKNNLSFTNLSFAVTKKIFLDFCKLIFILINFYFIMQDLFLKASALITGGDKSCAFFFLLVQATSFYYQILLLNFTNVGGFTYTNYFEQDIKVMVFTQFLLKAQLFLSDSLLIFFNKIHFLKAIALITGGDNFCQRNLQIFL